jgi:MFS family permease
MPFTSERLITKSAVLSVSLILTSAVAISSALPQLNEALGATITQGEMLSTMPNVAVAIFVLLSNGIIRKYGVKRTVTVGLLLVGAGGIVPVFANSYPLILASRLVMGVGLGMYNAPAISIISTMYSGKECANLLGLRSAAENVGQSIFMAAAGLLLAFGWHWSFTIYFAAFPLAIFFWLVVPGVSLNGDEPKKKSTEKTAESGYKAMFAQMNPFVYALALLAVLLLLNAIAVQVRFPSLMEQLKGEQFNSGLILSLMPLVGILAGVVFGQLYGKIDRGVLYLGLIAYIAADLLIGLSHNNVALIILGLLLSGIPNAWCFPYIFNGLGSITSRRTVAFATSIIIIGTNTGTFIAPLAMKAIQTIGGTDSLLAPFPVLAGIFTAVLAGVMIHDLQRARR